MTIEMEDISGRPPSLGDIREAKDAMRKLIVVAMMKLPPEIAIQIPNAHRCLTMLEEIVTKYEAKKSQTAG